MKNSRTILPVIGIATFMSIVALYAVAIFLSSKGSIKPLMDQKTIELLFYGLAFLSLGIVVNIFIFKGRLRTEKESEIPQERKIMTLSILTIAMSEAPSIYGFILFILGGTIQMMLPFAVLSILLLVITLAF